MIKYEDGILEIKGTGAEVILDYSIITRQVSKIVPKLLLNKAIEIALMTDEERHEAFEKVKANRKSTEAAKSAFERFMKEILGEEGE